MKRREFLQIAATATVCSGIGFYAGRVSRFSLAKYVQLGTSLTAGSGTKYNGRIPELVAHQLGMNSIGINGGLAGSCAGDHKFPSLNSVSLVAICNAIVSGDWSAQSGRRDPAISWLMTTGFDSVTHIGLEYGTNDFRYDRPIGTNSDSCKETFKGALNFSIRALLHRYPNVRVFLMTPWWMPTFDGRDSDEHPNDEGHFLVEYVRAMQRVAEINHIPCLDLWATSGVSKANIHDFTVDDGTHLNDAGAIRRADMIAKFMRAVF